MYGLLWIVPTLPLLGFLTLAFCGKRLPRKAVATVGAGSVGLAAAIVMGIGYQFLTSPPPGSAFTQVLWTWMNVGGFQPEIALYLDSLSLTMIVVVTGVGFLIHLYSIEYMIDDDAYSRFFAYMNLFVCSMLLLVLGDNLLLLYLGWEGVGLCSFLLIGFWYKEGPNCRAAFKAFLVTRVGDTAMALGLFLIVMRLGTLRIQDILYAAPQQWAVGSGVAIAAAALLLGGAVGKSGQLPLQVWLPDAMAGPTPVSALIHAATMVTAGVYLIARTHTLFELAPPVMHAVAVIGAATLLLAGFSALTQRDIKRVLAYSTISQIGYMFLALGVGAWSAAMFHFMTHAFFKALLFMGAGAIIVSLHHEQDIFKMGGLRKQLPLVFWTFLIGAMSLASLPLITAGFYSKDFILYCVWSSEHGSKVLWLAGWLGAGMTGLYTFRMVFITFFGEAKGHVHKKPGFWLCLPLVILALLTSVAGFLELPRTLGNWPWFSHWMESALPAAKLHHGSVGEEAALQIVAEAAVLAGLVAAYILFLKNPRIPQGWAATPFGARVHRLWFTGWGFDWLYDVVFVQPFLFIAQVNRNDFIDLFSKAIAAFSRGLHYALSRTQSGYVRWYLMGVAIGAAITIALAMYLS